jgi:hypothetical protein
MRSQEDFMEINFSKLSPEQDKLLREILGICRYFQVSRTWIPSVGDDVLARQAREIGWKIAQLEKVS